MTAVRISWLVEGQWMGFKEYETQTQFVPDSVAIFCPYTGEIWARGLVQQRDMETYQHIWTIKNGASRRASHPSVRQFQTPGAIPWYFFNCPAYPASDELWLYQAKTLLALWEAGYPAVRGI